MPVFDLLCLANSNKLRGSCIAGLRMDGGGWIRPVARTTHGELYPAHYCLQDGSCPRLFDVIRISFERARPAPHQPEIWLIADEPWQLLRRAGREEVASLLEANLATGPALLGDYSHKISFDRFASEPAAASLALIQPANLSWVISQTPENAHKPRAKFQLGGTSYLLPVTDPVWLDAFRALPLGKHPLEACGIDPAMKTLLTISLGEPFEDGWCYKLVTAIVPVEPGLAPEPEPPMDRAEAAWIIDALANGRDPYTGDPLPAEGPLSNPDTTKALRAASAALQRRLPRERVRELPEKAGEAWDPQEEEMLVREFDAGQSMKSIALTHGRTRGAIKARLIRLGRIQA
jgi:hypothetical protein